MKTKYSILMMGEEQRARDPFGTNIASSFAGNMFETMGRTNAMVRPGLHTETLDKKEFNELSHNPMVLGMAPHMPLKLISPTKTTQVQTVNQSDLWGLDAVGATVSPYSGKGIKVAVLDTGIEHSHEAFKGVNLIQSNFTSEADHDINGHGTHVAGTIFGQPVDGINIGVAPGIDAAIIGKVLGENDGSTVSLFDAILWASDLGANVISMSLGIDFPGLVDDLVGKGWPVNLATSRALEGYRANILLFEKLSAYLKSRELFLDISRLVAASGNESMRNVNPAFEIAASPPSVSQGVLSVGAVENTNAGLKVADFSNTGCDVVGPGVDIISAKLGGGLISFDGTSMATPHVAGVMTLWAEKLLRGGRLNGTELEGRVIGNAQKANMHSGTDPFDVGAGLVRAPQS